MIYSDETINRIVPIPRHLLKPEGSLLHLTIKTPEATSPAALGMSSDLRILGIGLREIELIQGSAFNKALQKLNCQPPQCLMWDAKHKDIPMQVGKRVSNAIRSTGQPGFLVFGPSVYRANFKTPSPCKSRVQNTTN